jgi:hypothetical protein
MKDVDNDVAYNMSEICRLCLSKDGGILPIFGEEESGNQSVPLSFRILACVSIEASIILLRLNVQCNLYNRPLLMHMPVLSPQRQGFIMEAKLKIKCMWFLCLGVDE